MESKVKTRFLPCETSACELSQNKVAKKLSHKLRSCKVSPKKKVKSISFCQFKVFLPSCEISDELSFEFQCGNFYCIEGMDMAWSQSEHVHEQTDRNQIDKYCCLYTLYMSETFNKVKIC